MSEFEYKQVILVRVDLNMSIGKTAVQTAHAAVSAAEDARKKYPRWWSAWISEGQKKVALKVKSLSELLNFKEKAEDAGLPCALIQDRGLTELAPGTYTCLGIGPAPNDKIDKLTGHLPLL
ncbi:MAG: peptidyl-tRNA hydrolase Pth2 [Candidatus Odinarchaeia archaeon]